MVCGLMFRVYRQLVILEMVWLKKIRDTCIQILFERYRHPPKTKPPATNFNSLPAAND